MIKLTNDGKYAVICNGVISSIHATLEEAMEMI